MYTIIYFSPTGNVAHLANGLSQKFSKDVKTRPLEFTNPEELIKDKHLILMYSIHGFNAPRTVKRFVKNLPENLYEKVSIIAVGCNTGWVNGATSLDIKRVLNRKGYPVIVDEVLAMPLTFIMEFPDDAARKSINESELKLVEIAKAIVADKKSTREIVFKSKLINFIGKAEGGAARTFGLELHASKACTSCGTCWENCPEKNIKPNKDNRPKFGLKCLMCMRCVYNCPVQAISPRLAKFIPIKNGYTINKYLDK